MKLVIHIGTEKTASTSLQYFFDDNRKSFTQVGVHYAKSFGARNHRQLVAACMDHSKTDQWINGRNLATKLNRSRLEARVRKKFTEEMSQLPDTINTVLVSSEHFHSRLTLASELVTLNTFFDEFFSSIEVFVYLRRQSSVLESKYTTYLCAGGDKNFRQFAKVEAHLKDPYYEYATMLSLWSNEFGVANIKVREFAPSQFYGQHICYDFLNRLNATLPLSCFELTEDKNRSLNRTGLNLLRLLNYIINARKPDGSVNRKHRSMKFWILKWFRGAKPKLLSTTDAQRFDQRFELSNRAVEKLYDMSLFR
jgi:hypothetical protein